MSAYGALTVPSLTTHTSAECAQLRGAAAPERSDAVSQCLSVNGAHKPIALVAAGLSHAHTTHRLDEYLQAARIDLQRAAVCVTLELTPGAAVAESVIRTIDRDGDRSQHKRAACHIEDGLKWGIGRRCGAVADRSGDVDQGERCRY